MKGAVAAMAAVVALGAPTAALAEGAQKVTTPVVGAWASDDGAKSWHKKTDAMAGRATWFGVEATMPSNMADFNTYMLRFVVDAPEVDLAGHRADVFAVSPEGRMHKVTGDFAFEHDEDTITAHCDDLLAAAKKAGAALADGWTAFLAFEGTVPADAGSEKPVWAHVEHSSRPENNAEGQSVKDSAALITWELEVKGADGRPAAYTLRAEDGTYIAADGSHSKEPVQIRAADDASALVSSLASGTYRIETLDGQGKGRTAKVEVDGTPVASQRSVANGAWHLAATSADAKVGVEGHRVQVTMPVNRPVWSLPSTGASALGVGLLALGLAGVGVGARVLVRVNRAPKDES